MAFLLRKFEFRIHSKSFAGLPGDLYLGSLTRNPKSEIRKWNKGEEVSWKTYLSVYLGRAQEKDVIWITKFLDFEKSGG
jgi:hypothetical protein